MANLKSIEFKNGIATTSDAHLDAKYEVATLVERDLLITTQSVKRGATLYFDSDSESGFPRGIYFLNTYPTNGVLTGVVWSPVNGGSDSAAEVKNKYESNADTNVYSNADKDKLDNIEYGATVDQTALEVPFTPTGNTTSTNVQDAIVELQDEIDSGGGGGAVDSVNGQTGVVVLESDDITEGVTNLYNQAHTGDVTGSTSLTISNGAVSNIKLASMASLRLRGRITAGTGVVENLGATQVRSLLSLDNVDNTSDVNKPVSTATLTALNAKSDNLETLTVGEAVSTGDILYLNTDGTYYKASNLLESSSIGSLRIAAEDIAAGAGLLAKEFIIPTVTAMPISSLLYLGDDGAYIDKAAAALLPTDTIVRIVGTINSTQRAEIKPDVSFGKKA